MSALTPYTFFFDTPLYNSIEITSENLKEFKMLLLGNLTVEGYNPSLKQETTYHVIRHHTISYSPNSFSLVDYVGVLRIDLACARNQYKIIFTTLLGSYEDEAQNVRYVFQKIGQFPSLADLHISKVKQYDKILEREKIKEFTRAIGLAANGIGIGSYVYLRRIFEDLVEEAHQLGLQAAGWDEDIYTKSRMSERIGMLEHHLPKFLSDHKQIYGILSVGIHSLNEQECLDHFDTLKDGIEMILDEKIEKRLKEKKSADAAKKIQELGQKTKS